MQSWIPPNHLSRTSLSLRIADKSLLSPVVERMEKKLTTWKANYLSLGGRVTLIRSVLSSLPNYYISIFKCPASIAIRIEKLQRDFLCNGGNTEKKIHLVDWNPICKSKFEGGLGIRSISLMNQALSANGCGG